MSNNQPIAVRENLEDGYEQIKNIYKIQVDKLKTSDEKLNILLVFNAAILALLIILIPFPNEQSKRILSLVIFSIFTVSILITVICVFIGLFPKKLPVIDIKNFTRASQYNCTREEYIGKYMAGYESMVENVMASAGKKQTIIKHSMVETIVNIVLIVMLILIKIV